VSGLPPGPVSSLTVRVENICLRATVLKLGEFDYRFVIAVDERPAPGSPVGPFSSLTEARDGAKHTLTAWVIEILGQH
jgi:hypothetical protein